MRDFYPSLYLNLGWFHEQLGDRHAAHYWYALAAQHATALPADSYGATVRDGIAAGLRRLATAE